MRDLSDVAISIKTFLRDLYLFETLDAITQRMPEAQIIVTDDGNPSPAKSKRYEDLRRNGHIVIEMPFDSGFGAKSNRAAAESTRPYLLIGSDDFDFRPPSVREGIEKLAMVLDAGVAEIASGRVGNYPYEGWLEDRGDRIREIRIKQETPLEAGGVGYLPCDLTVNYSLIMGGILSPGSLHWYEDIKIGGGEHGAFFLLAKRLGYRVVYVPGVNINEQQPPKPIHAHYHAFRGRARQPGRPAFVRMGVKEYVLFDGTVEKA